MTAIEKVTAIAESKIRKIAVQCVNEEYWVTHYGANDIHPENFVFWFWVRSDAERDRLLADTELMRRLRGVLDEVDYPKEGRDHVVIGLNLRKPLIGIPAGIGGTIGSR